MLAVIKMPPGKPLRLPPEVGGALCAFAAGARVRGKS